MGMQMQGTYRLRMLMLGVTAALASCLIALVLATSPAQATHLPIDLSVSQTDSPDPLESGNITYTLTVKQELVDGCGSGGCGNSSGRIRVTDTLPSDADTVAVNPGSGASCELTSNVTCIIGDLSDGDSVDISIVVRPTTAGPRTLTNTATVSNADGYPDPNTTNNTSTATTQVSESYTPTPDTTAPETTLIDKPNALSSNASPRFSFAANEAPTTFECQMDANAFQSCSNPKQYFLLSEGEHTFQVRAKDRSGNVDQTPAQHTWTVDSKDPKVTFTQRPGTATGPDRWDEWVTNDRSPTWAWTAEDLHLDPDQVSCDLDEGAPDYRDILSIEPCASPFTFEGELPDGNYSFDVEAYDGAGNYGDAYNYFEVDTVAPKFVSGKPTGQLVSPYASVVVNFDDNVHNSKQFVNIYKGSSNTPLAVYRYAYGGKKIEIYPKNSLRRDTRYTVKVTTGVNDGANNLATAKTWSFKTK